MAKKETTCSFCGANRANVQMLIAGVSGHICDSCAVQANSFDSTHLAGNDLVDFDEICAW
jgi:ATP-dependent Clp protease ATP-binding subunit ClpX